MATKKKTSASSAKKKTSASKKAAASKSGKKTTKATDKGLGFQGGALGGDYSEAEMTLAQETPLAMSAMEGIGQGPQILTINIAGVRTASQAGNQTTFLLNNDALALVIDISASQDMVNSGKKFDANFQIIEYATNTVKRDSWTSNLAFQWGMNFWISQGNNWGPTANDYTTPAKWGLGTGLFIFRATVAVQGLPAFSFSTEHVFRVR